MLEAELSRLLASRRDYGAFILAGVTALLTLLPLAGNNGILDAYPAYWPLVPLLPLGVLAYAVRQNRRIIVLQYYARAIEHELRTLSRELRPHSLDQFGGNRLTLPSLFTLDAASMSTKRGDATLSFAGAIYNMALFASVLGVVVISMTKVRQPLLCAVLSVSYGAIFTTLAVILIDSALNGRMLWRRLTISVTEGETPARATLLRRAGYLILPRPRAFFVKGTLFFALPALVISAMPGVAPLDASNLLLGWFLFEFLIMQGRYILNDIVGWGSDSNGHDATHVRAANLFNCRAGAISLLGIFGLSRSILGISVALAQMTGGTFLFVFFGLAEIVVTAFYEWARHNFPRTSPQVVTTVFVGYFPRVICGIISGGLGLSLETATYSFLLSAVATALVFNVWQERYKPEMKPAPRWRHFSLATVGATCAHSYIYLSGNSVSLSMVWAVVTWSIFILSQATDGIRAQILTLLLVIVGAIIWHIAVGPVSVIPIVYANLVLLGWILAKHQRIRFPTEVL